MKSYKKITNINYMENCCKCDEYKEELATQSSRITCLEYEIEDLKIEKQEFVKKITVIEKENYIKIFNFYIIYLLLTI